MYVTVESFYLCLFRPPLLSFALRDSVPSQQQQQPGHTINATSTVTAPTYTQLADDSLG